VNDSEARRDVLSSEQKGELAKIQRLLVEVIAITDQGPADPGALTKTVERRMQVLGYTVVTDPQQPHEAVLRVKCEEHKAWEGTTQSGGDADLPDSPSRVWKGQHFPGHMGNERVTTRHLRVIKVDAEENLLLVRGAVPGSKRGIVILRPAVKR